MTLRVTIISPAKVPPGFEQAIELDEGPVAIGRAPDCDLVLADSARQLSKRHCTIALGGGGCTLTDTSANGVYVNGAAERTPRDQPVAIAPGDVLRLGEYELRLEEAGAGAALADPMDRTEAGAFAPPLPDEPEAGAEDDFDLGFALGGDDEDADSNPFADAARLMRDTPERDAPDFGAPDDGDYSGGGSSGDSLLPHGPEGTLYAKPSGGRARLDPFGSSKGLPDDWEQPPMPDNVPSEQSSFNPPNVNEPPPEAPSAGSDGGIPDDWDLDADETFAPQAEAPAPPPAPAPPSPAQSSPFLEPPGQAPRPVPPPRPRPVPAQPEAAPGGGLSDAAALRAFLNGVGLGSMRLTESEAVTLLAEAGRVFRTFVAGLQEALATRAEIKEELNVDRTMIGATSNNPLKLNLSVDEGVVAMLKRPGHGFLAPVEAVDQGFRDVQAHQVATMAAMHLALRRLLGKFDPDVLQRRLEQSSLMGSLMPGARKSKYWEVYCDFYASIAGDAESEFHEFFTKEFSRAYEEQSRKLK